MKTQKNLFSTSVIASFVYTVWAIIFIYRSSFIAIDGERYFSLMDDAMISMRYAWNLAHGYGLVWNPGEFVEGYSNPLMTILMALICFFFHKKMAVLVVQVLGIPIVLACAFVARRLAYHLYSTHKTRDLIADLTFVGVLLYYPLSFWSLMGMETGLLTFLLLMGISCGIRWTNDHDDYLLYISSAFMGFAFLTRNEALLLSILLFGFLFFENSFSEKTLHRLPKIIKAGLIFSIFVLLQIAFRWFYYGELVPNTYTLKVSQIPLTVRINDGLIYSLGFIVSFALPWILSSTGFLLARNRKTALLLSFPLLFTVYQLWTGGDVFTRWRFFVPVVPFLFISSFAGIDRITDFLSHFLKDFGQRKNIIIIILLALCILISNFNFFQEAFFITPLPETSNNEHTVSVAIAIKALTKPEASIGVFTAGTLPFYSDRHAIDFLGKADPYIASLYPHLPQKVNWFQPATMPGHNKYDLNYSIKKLQPTYIQRFYWGEQNIRGWALEHYTKIEYYDKKGSVTLILLKDSPLVYWEKGIPVP